MPRQTSAARHFLESLPQDWGNPVARNSVLARLEGRWSKERQEILLDLANLQDDSCEHFRRRFDRLDVALQEDDEAILRFRNELRIVWREEDLPFGEVLQYWGHCVNGSSLPAFRVMVWRDVAHSFVPNSNILALSLGMAASEWKSKMGVCENPDCVQPYFLNGRSTQRFCDRRACSAFGQREHKRKWWAEHGQEWKRKRAKSPHSKGKSDKAKSTRKIRDASGA